VFFIFSVWHKEEGNGLKLCLVCLMWQGNLHSNPISSLQLIRGYMKAARLYIDFKKQIPIPWPTQNHFSPDLNQKILQDSAIGCTLKAKYGAGFAEYVQKMPRNQAVRGNHKEAGISKATCVRFSCNTQPESCLLCATSPGPDMTAQ